MCDAIIKNPELLIVKYICHEVVCRALDEQIVQAMGGIGINPAGFEYDHLTGVRKLQFRIKE